MDEETRYEAVCSRDARFDGEFFFAVATTGIYCRPSCPAVTPKRRNVRFYPTAAAAQGSGFRACRRCRPDAVPGSAEWNVRADLVGRAMRLIGDGVVDREGVAGLADRLGYSTRQVNRQLTAELGAGPVALARAQRAHTARVLLQTTELPVTELAFAAGFASVRQFNDTIREVYARTPSEVRAAVRPAAARRPGRAGAAGRPGSATGARQTGQAVRVGRSAVGEPRGPRDAAADRGSAPHAPQATPSPQDAPGGIPLRLAYRGAYAAREIFDFLARRAITGIEEILGDPGSRTYRRTLALPYGQGIAEVGETVGAAATAPSGGWLDCRLHLTDLRDLTTAVQRVRRLFDLDADPYAVAERLGADPRLGPLIAARPGVRSPGAVDPHELAVRAVLGQQVTVGSAVRLAGTLVAAYGKPLAVADGTLTHLFPDAGTLAGADLAELGMPDARRRALRTISAAIADGTVRLDPGADREAAERAQL
ncbi:AlkA N-terminal domain-containing protein, partial [Streptomyces sp. H27-D2]|uniref:AlkA N-terminal domain-containing protein n=1 Tax=Streptomyces sp. H27-D2 TaxID=3046304 RepID=UPI002DBB9F31